MCNNSPLLTAFFVGSLSFLPIRRPRILSGDVAPRAGQNMARPWRWSLYTSSSPSPSPPSPPPPPHASKPGLHYTRIAPPQLPLRRTRRRTQTPQQMEKAQKPTPNSYLRRSERAKRATENTRRTPHARHTPVHGQPGTPARGAGNRGGQRKQEDIARSGKTCGRGRRHNRNNETMIANTFDEGIKGRKGWGRTGVCGYNRPCAHQHVGKYQSCMVENGRFIRTWRRSSTAPSNPRGTSPHR